MRHCLNCGLVLEESEFCNQLCEDEYYSQEEYVCSCEPYMDEVGVGEVDEQQENEDFAHDNDYGDMNEDN